MKYTFLKRLGAVLLASACCSAFLAGCTNPADSSSSGTSSGTSSGISSAMDGDATLSPQVALDRGNTVVIGTTDFNGQFHLLFSNSVFDQRVALLVFDTLLEVDDNGNSIDGMASCVISEDELLYTFKLKEGLTYSDGTPVKAADFITAFNIICDPTYDGAINVTSYSVKGAADYRSGAAKEITGVVAKGDQTLEVTLDKPNASALYFLGDLPAMHPSYAEAYKFNDISGVKALNTKPVGNGQYVFQEYKEGQSVTMTANASYWKGAPKIEKVIFSVTPTGKELDRVIIGETDFEMANAEPDIIDQAHDAGFIQTHIFPTNGYGYIGINNKDAKYADPKVRQALLYALNRKEIVESIYGEYANVLNIPQSSQSWVYTADGIESYDFKLEKASALLEEAGWKKNANGKLEKDGKEFVINFTAMTDHAITTPLLPVMKDDYAKIGIQLNIDTAADFPTLKTRVEKGDCEMFFMAWSLTADPDPSNVYGTKGSQNYLGYSNTKMDELLQKGLDTTDSKERKEIYKEIYQLWNQDVPAMLIYQRSDMWTVNARLKNFKVSPYRSWAKDFWQVEASI